MVTIKLKDVDVTMPKCCDECPFRNVTEAFDENGMALFPITECSLLERFVGYSDDEHVKSKRLDDCPIVSVRKSVVAHRMMVQRMEAIKASYSLAEKALSEYKERVKEATTKPIDIWEDLGEFEKYVITRKNAPYARHIVLRFENGYGASLINGKYAYTNTLDDWEMACLIYCPDKEPDIYELCYPDWFDNDVKGYLSSDEVLHWLQIIKDHQKEDWRTIKYIRQKYETKEG